MALLNGGEATASVASSRDLAFERPESRRIHAEERKTVSAERTITTSSRLVRYGRLQRFRRRARPK